MNCRITTSTCPAKCQASRRIPGASLRPWLVYPAGTSICRRSAGSARLPISSKSHPASPKFRGQSISFLDWAEGYIDQFDPLSKTALDPDQLPEPSSYYRGDDEPLKKLLLRLIGVDGPFLHGSHARHMLEATDRRVASTIQAYMAHNQE
jgi:hypothetical protein